MLGKDEKQTFVSIDFMTQKSSKHPSTSLDQNEHAFNFVGDVFLGFLHTDNYNKPSLVFDMIEPFRILAERATVLLFTGRRVKAEFFEEVPGGVALSKEGRGAFLPYYNERLDRPVKYPVQSKPGKYRKIKRRDTIAHEAHALANRLLGKTDMPRIVATRVLWEEGTDEPADEPSDEPEDSADQPSGEP